MQVRRLCEDGRWATEVCSVRFPGRSLEHFSRLEKQPQRNNLRERLTCRWLPDPLSSFLGLELLMGLCLKSFFRLPGQPVAGWLVLLLLANGIPFHLFQK